MNEKSTADVLTHLTVNILVIAFIASLFAPFLLPSIWKMVENSMPTNLSAEEYKKELERRQEKATRITLGVWAVEMVFAIVVTYFWHHPIT